MTAVRAAYNADEAGALYGVSGWQIRAMVRDGKLAKVPHLGRLVRISAAELERVLGPIPQAVPS